MNNKSVLMFVVIAFSAILYSTSKNKKAKQSRGRLPLPSKRERTDPNVIPYSKFRARRLIQESEKHPKIQQVQFDED